MNQTLAETTQRNQTRFRNQGDLATHEDAVSSILAMLRHRTNSFPRWLCFVTAMVGSLVGQAAEFSVIYNSEPDTNAAPTSPQERLAKVSRHHFAKL